VLLFVVCVCNRFSDFVWLHERLCERCLGFVIPPLPPKSLMRNTSDAFVLQRMKLLQQFMQRLAQHPILRLTFELQVLLLLLLLLLLMLLFLFMFLLLLLLLMLLLLLLLVLLLLLLLLL